MKKLLTAILFVAGMAYGEPHLVWQADDGSLITVTNGGANTNTVTVSGSLSDAGTNYFRNAANQTNMAAAGIATNGAIFPEYMLGESGYTASAAFGPYWTVPFSDTDAAISAGFHVSRGGTFNLAMTWAQSVSNVSKTMSGKLYIATNDYKGIEHFTWNLYSASNADLSLPDNPAGSKYAKTQTVFTVVPPFVVQDNSYVGAYYGKDDNAGGATGNVVVYGFQLLRVTP